MVLAVARAAGIQGKMKMQAVEANEYAANLSAVFINGSAVLPQASSDEVLVKIEGSSVNPIDWKVLDGKYQAFFPLSFPNQILGSDIVGTVVQSHSTRFKVGDRVWADIGSGSNDRGRSGAWAEFVAVPQNKLSQFPRSVPWPQSAPSYATLPLVAKTMWQSLEVAGLTPHAGAGKTVVITSGTGGTGTVGVQLAKALGAAYVITTAGARGSTLLKQLGADQVVDYRTQDLFSVLAPDSVDAVIDNYGYDANAALRVLRSGGTFVSLTHQSPNTTKPGVETFAITCNASRHDDLDAIGALVNQGLLRPVVQKSFAMSDILAALHASIAGGSIGKLALAPLH